MMLPVGSSTDFERGFLVGLLIGEGHFGVSKGTAQFVIGMHVRHESLLRHTQDLLPGTILYGPYHHQGRDFFRLTARGAALRGLLDVFDSLEIHRLCPHVARRYAAMRVVAATMRTLPSRRDRFTIFVPTQKPRSIAKSATEDQHFGSLLGCLADPAAPTSVHDGARARDVHIADSLSALDVPGVPEARRIADLGSGAGLPGLVLAIALPEAEVALVESVGKKCAWMEATVERLGLTNARVVCSRVEEWDEGLGVCDAVTARALGALPVVCEYAAPLLREGGVLVAWKGAVDEVEEADGLAAAEALGLERDAVLAVEPYAGSERRTLHVFRKVAPTPERYPRRAGMAAKRPVSARLRRADR